ncbi:MAG TPA: beta-propeller fold lactonase family protein [Candidatus Acidoferrum sp.]|nr:beta-propeller fold lactonase family protein [Candidatus Acidoferrum sp.]
MRFRLVIAALSLLIALHSSPAASAESQEGAVYVASNEASVNRILQFLRDEHGVLTTAGSFNTGGLGTGTGLGNQGGVVLTDDGQWLLVVNAGSNDISVFAVDSDSDSLKLADRKGSGGQRPISVATKHGLVYVLNAGGGVGGADSVAGFRLTRRGQLVPIPGSSAPLSAANTGPAEIHFGLDDDELFVTEKNTNRVDAFQLDESGAIRSSETFSSTGAEPFGFSVSRIADAILVSNAAGGAANASSLTSYQFDDGALSVLAGPVPTNQSAACWAVATRSGRFAYTTNTGSGSVSGYSIAEDGTATLLNSDGITAVVGKGPIDAGFSFGDRFLFVLNSGDHSISALSVGHDGSLRVVGTTTGLPPASNGLAAR